MMTMPITLQTTRDDHLIAWLAALAITIHIAEGILPSPLPGIKPGLANVITIAVLLRYGWRMALWVSLLRVLAGSLLLGTFLSPAFILSLSGALCSIAIIGAAYSLRRWLPGRGLGPLGYSVLAAMAHMAGQFWIAYTLFIPHPGLLHLLPVLMTAAVIFGIVSGIIANAMLTKIPA
ncbi:MAG: Gx transporter family protein [Gammaproteobacteria bacterium]